MQRPRPTFWIATATVAALALGGGVAAARADAPTQPSRGIAPPVASTPGGDDTAAPVESAPCADDPATATTTLPPSVVTAPPQAPPVDEGGPGHPWAEDHGNDAIGESGPGGPASG